jgi:hypothetical protein
MWGNLEAIDKKKKKRVFQWNNGSCDFIGCSVDKPSDQQITLAVRQMHQAVKTVFVYIIGFM